jgi:aromatic-L-amino-acid decarboxylase
MDAREFQEIGHQVVDLLADYLDHIEEKSVFPRIDPQALRNLFDEPLPESPSSANAVLAEIQTKLLPYCTHVGHPGYMGLITPSPNPIGVIGDFLCSALNQNLGAYSIGPAASPSNAALSAGSPTLLAMVRPPVAISPAAV